MSEKKVGVLLNCLVKQNTFVIKNTEIDIQDNIEGNLALYNVKYVQNVVTIDLDQLQMLSEKWKMYKNSTTNF